MVCVCLLVSVMCAYMSVWVVCCGMSVECVCMSMVCVEWVAGFLTPQGGYRQPRFRLTGCHRGDTLPLLSPWGTSRKPSESSHGLEAQGRLLGLVSTGPEPSSRSLGAIPGPTVHAQLVTGT